MLVISCVLFQPLLHLQRPEGEKQQKKIAAHAASVAGEARGKNKQFTEEEAYMVRRQGRVFLQPHAST